MFDVQLQCRELEQIKSIAAAVHVWLPTVTLHSQKQGDVILCMNQFCRCNVLLWNFLVFYKPCYIDLYIFSSPGRTHSIYLCL